MMCLAIDVSSHPYKSDMHRSASSVVQCMAGCIEWPATVEAELGGWLVGCSRGTS